jgi:hypothetical protein
MLPAYEGKNKRVSPFMLVKPCNIACQADGAVRVSLQIFVMVISDSQYQKCERNQDDKSDYLPTATGLPKIGDGVFRIHGGFIS